MRNPIDVLEAKALDYMQLEPAESIERVERTGVRAVAMLGMLSLGAMTAIGAKYGVDQVMHTERILPFSTNSDEAFWQGLVRTVNVSFASFLVGMNAIGVSLGAAGVAVTNRIRRRYPDQLSVGQEVIE